MHEKEIEEIKNTLNYYWGEYFKKSAQKIISETDKSLRENKRKVGANKMVELVDCIVENPKVVLKWSDGTVTVVKAQEGDNFSAEAGFALAYLKKSCGNTGRYNDLMKRWINKRDDEKKAREEEKAKEKAKEKAEKEKLRKIQKDKELETKINDAARKEEQIQMQTEAFERAIKNLVNDGTVELPAFLKNLLRK